VGCIEKKISRCTCYLAKTFTDYKGEDVKINLEDKKVLIESVKTALLQCESNGQKITDSEMFKYTPAYTGDAWEKPNHAKET